MPAVVRKTPTPIISETTTAVAVVSPSRRSSAGPEGDGGVAKESGGVAAVESGINNPTSLNLVAVARGERKSKRWAGRRPCTDGASSDSRRDILGQNIKTTRARRLPAMMPTEPRRTTVSSGSRKRESRRLSFMTYFMLDLVYMFGPVPKSIDRPSARWKTWPTRELRILPSGAVNTIETDRLFVAHPKREGGSGD